MRTLDIPTNARAQTLRAASTEAEKKLWQRLRDRRLGGAKFVRQALVGPYYADFPCRARKLIVEVDGSQHADVLGSIDDVCETIIAAIESRLTPFDRFKMLTTNGGAAPHPALRATFSPQAGRRG